MAQNNQNVTISLTLPISCQICLGKVRQPVVCCNHHVFCSICMEVWLSKTSQCPTCRVPITSDNPCKEILGATNEGDCPTSPTLKRRLRKTRGELLLKEYEDEIESLMRENEELRNKNRAAETQLETFLEPHASVSVSSGEECGALDPLDLEEWASKLRVATDLYDKVKQDVEKLREANKTLQSQNVDLVQENMRLKAEVESRSPQKYGRYTVAALEAKIQQYERDMAHLKRALERSDSYIEELENQRTQLDKDDVRFESTHTGAPESSITPSGDRIATMRRSLSEMEETSVHTDLGVALPGFRGTQDLLLTTSEGPFQESSVSTPRDILSGVEPVSPLPAGPLSPTTPSSALRGLCLRSPLGQSERRVGQGKGGSGLGRGPLSYLRRLSFEGCVKSTTTTLTSEQMPVSMPPSLQGAVWKSRRSFGRGDAKTSDVLHQSIPDSSKASSEACMDAAYQEKMSELDSLISDDENPIGNMGSCEAHGSFGATGSFLSDPNNSGVQRHQRKAPGEQLHVEGSAQAGLSESDGASRQQSAGETGENKTDEYQATPGLSTEPSSSTSSSSLLSSSMPSLASNQVAQGSKRRCRGGSPISSPSKLSKQN